MSSSPASNASARTLRVLHLTGDAEDAGGILSVLRNLQPEFKSLGVEQSVWVQQAYEESRRPPLDYRRSQQVCGFATTYARLLGSTWPAFRDLRHLLQSEPFDVLHGHTQGTLLVALLAAYRTRRPVFFTNHSYANLRLLYRWIARYTRLRVILLTPNMARHFGLLTAQGSRVPLVSECAAPEFFSAPLEGKPGPRRPLRFVGVGAIMRWKRWDLVAGALSQLAPAERAGLEFHLWGGTSKLGDSEAFDGELNRQIATDGIGAQFKRCGTTHRVRAEVSAADWFLLPSTNEPCSVALIEALALGVPAIVSRSGGNTDIITEGVNGLFFEPGNPANLAAVLRRIIKGEVSMASAQTIRESVRKRIAGEVAREYHQLYQSALSRNR